MGEVNWQYKTKTKLKVVKYVIGILTFQKKKYFSQTLYKICSKSKS